MFSSFDVFEMTKELRKIVGMRVNNVYHIPEFNEIRIKFFGRGRRDLVITDKAFYLTKYPKSKETPTSFAMFLRKYLKNLKILDVEQVNFDRIVEFSFGIQEVLYILVAEIFSKGNIVLCNKDYGIINVLRREVWSSRKLLPHEKYLPPPSKLSPFISREDFEKLKIEGEKDLVQKFNFGGIYAKEIFLRAKEFGVDLYQAMHSFKKKPNIVDEPLPYDLLIFRDREKTYFESFNEACDEFFGKKTMVEMLDVERKKVLEKIEKQKIILENQKKSLKEFEAKKEKYKRIGDLIYENYQLIEEILNFIHEEKKRYQWEEIVERIKNSKFGERVLHVDYKNGFIVLDLEEEVKLDFRKKIYENASYYYEISKKMSRKIKGVEKAIKVTEEKIEKMKEKKFKEVKIKALRKREWFEKFRWFYSSEGFLVLGGRDARSNETLVKKYMENNDLYLHADIHGASSVVIKNGKNCGKKTIEQACKFAAVFSKAWNYFGAVDCYWVYPNQVTKTPPSGEFLQTGAFFIQGKKNILKNVELELAIGIYEDKVMAGPIEAVEKNCKNYVVIVFGDERKEKVAKKISKILGFDDLDEIVRALPGKCRILS